MANYTRSPDTVVSEPPTDQPWINPNNAKVDDDIYTSCGPVIPSTAGSSDNLYASNFGFQIPVGAQLEGITVTIKRYWDSIRIVPNDGVPVTYSGSEVSDSFIVLTDGSVAYGVNKSQGALWSLDTPETVVFGGPTDLWNAGKSISREIINDPSFGLWINCYISGGEDYGNIAESTAYIDYIEMTIFYSGSNIKFGNSTVSKIYFGNTPIYQLKFGNTNIF